MATEYVRQQLIRPVAGIISDTRTRGSWWDAKFMDATSGFLTLTRLQCGWRYALDGG